MDPTGKHLVTEAQELVSGANTRNHISILRGCTHCHIHFSALGWPLATLLYIRQITRDIQTDVIGFKKFSITISIPKVTNYRVFFGTNKFFLGNKIVCREMKSIPNMLTICECPFIHIFLVMLMQPSLQLSCRSDESHPTNTTTQAIVMLNSAWLTHKQKFIHKVYANRKHICKQQHLLQANLQTRKGVKSVTLIAYRK